MRPMVVLPEPLSPTSANTSPRRSEKLTSVTTRADFARLNNPPPETKVFERFATSSSALM
jgi:hypothetical protein